MLTAVALSAAVWLPAVASAEDLTIYSSLPLVGAARPQAEDVVRAEQLALPQGGNRAGPFSVGFGSLNDGSRKTGSWTPLRTVRNAHRGAAPAGGARGQLRRPQATARPHRHRHRPRAAQAFYAAFRARYGREPEPYALQGYEAMSVTLDAIRAAGPRGNDRAAVIAAFRTTHTLSAGPDLPHRVLKDPGRVI